MCTLTLKALFKNAYKALGAQFIVRAGNWGDVK